ncbi:hypothetical protein [Barnesiella intestinihominis]
MQKTYFYYADYEKITISPTGFRPDRHGAGFEVYVPGGGICRLSGVPCS